MKTITTTAVLLACYYTHGCSSLNNAEESRCNSFRDAQSKSRRISICDTPLSRWNKVNIGMSQDEADRILYSEPRDFDITLKVKIQGNHTTWEFVLGRNMEYTYIERILFGEIYYREFRTGSITFNNNGLLIIKSALK